MRFPLELTQNNVRKLVNGHPIQLRKEQLQGSKHWLDVHPTTHKRLSSAKAKGKGLRLTLTPEELQASGEGLGDLWNAIKKGARWVKDKIIDTPVYQSAVKPVVKGLVNAGVSAITPMLGPAGPLVQQGVEKLGEVTNAYGVSPELTMLQPKSKPKPKPKPRAKKALKSAPSGSIFLN